MLLKRITPISLGKMLGGLYTLLGLIGGVFFALAFEGLRSMLMFFLPGMPFDMDDGHSFSTFLLVILPLIYGAIGFISGIVIAFIYNGTARLFGGIELEFYEPKDTADLEEQGASQ